MYYCIIQMVMQAVDMWPWRLDISFSYLITVNYSSCMHMQECFAGNLICMQAHINPYCTLSYISFSMSTLQQKSLLLYFIYTTTITTINSIAKRTITDTNIGTIVPIFHPPPEKTKLGSPHQQVCTSMLLLVITTKIEGAYHQYTYKSSLTDSD